MTNSFSERLSRFSRSYSFIIAVFLCIFVPIRETLVYYTGTYIKIIPDVMIILLFLLYSVSIRFRYRFLMHDFLFLAYLALEFVSTVLVNHGGIMPFVFQVRSIGMLYVFYFVIRNFGFGKKELENLLRVLQVMAILLCLCAVVEIMTNKQYCFSSEFAKTIWYTNYSRAYSLFCNPNTFSLFLDFVFFISVYGSLCYGIKTSLPFYAVFMTGTFLSVSRSGMLILLIGCVFLYVWMLCSHRKDVKYVQIIVSAVLVIAIGALGYVGARKCAPLFYEKKQVDDPVATEKVSDLDQSSITERIETTLSPDQIEKSLYTGRLYTVVKGLEILKDYPIFGTGFGVFGSAASMNYRSPIADKYEVPLGFYSDNEYAKVIVEGGALGTLLFVLFLISILWHYRNDPIKLFFCVFIGYFGIFYNIFEVQAGMAFFWTILAFEKFPSISGKADTKE